MSYGTTITYNGIQWRHNTLQWDQCATTYLARDHNNSQWHTMETQGITMGPMCDNIPCKVTTEHSAFPDAPTMSLLHTIVLKRTVSTASLRVQRDILTTFQNVDIYKKSPATKQEVVSKVAQFASAAGIEAEGADAVEIPYVVHYVMAS